MTKASPLYTYVYSEIASAIEIPLTDISLACDKPLVGRDQQPVCDVQILDRLWR